MIKMNNSRIMGLDIGDVRIGIALSDLLGITAQGQETYTRTGDDEADADYIIAFADRNDVSRIVCGLPKNMNGTIGEQAEKTRAFADLIASRTRADIVFVDERLTTVSANRVLLEADTSRKKRKKVVDKIAATIILQTYLDSAAR